MNLAIFGLIVLVVAIVAAYGLTFSLYLTEQRKADKSRDRTLDISPRSSVYESEG